MSNAVVASHPISSWRLSLTGLAVLLLCGCGEPMGPLPGGKLKGDVKPYPPDWGFTSTTEDFQLETRPDDPYSVNVWAVDIGRDLYVAAGGGETYWARYLLSNPGARLKDQPDIFELSAVQVTDLEELLRVRKRFEEKYDLGEIGDEADDAIVFRLDPAS